MFKALRLEELLIVQEIQDLPADVFHVVRMLQRRHSLDSSDISDRVLTSPGNTIIALRFSQDLCTGDGKLLKSSDIVQRLLPELDSDYSRNETRLQAAEQEEVK